jgi:hypothetical protein
MPWQKPPDGSRCSYCGSKCLVSYDHVVPDSRGGPSAILNYTPACHSCNQRKRNKTPSEWAVTPHEWMRPPLPIPPEVLEIERRVRADFQIAPLQHVWTEARLQKCVRDNPALWSGVSLEYVQRVHDSGEQVWLHLYRLAERRAGGDA